MTETDLLDAALAHIRAERIRADEAITLLERARKVLEDIVVPKRTKAKAKAATPPPHVKRGAGYRSPERREKQAAAMRRYWRAKRRDDAAR